MALFFVPALIDVLLAGFAIFGVSRGQRAGIARFSGLTALFVLPLANFSLFWWVLSGIPFFPLLTPAGISLMVTGAIAVIAAIIAFVSALRGKRREIPE